MLAVFVQVSVYYSDDNFTIMIMSKLPTTIPQLAVPEKKRIFFSYTAEILLQNP